MSLENNEKRHISEFDSDFTVNLHEFSGVELLAYVI